MVHLPVVLNAIPWNSPPRPSPQLRSRQVPRSSDLRSSRVSGDRRRRRATCLEPECCIAHGSQLPNASPFRSIRQQYVRYRKPSRAPDSPRTQGRDKCHQTNYRPRHTKQPSASHANDGLRDRRCRKVTFPFRSRRGKRRFDRQCPYADKIRNPETRSSRPDRYIADLHRVFRASVLPHSGFENVCVRALEQLSRRAYLSFEACKRPIR